MPSSKLTRIIIPLWILLLLVVAASAHDNGQYSGSALKAWFDKLSSGKGLCCSFADGVSIQNVDWDIQNDYYRVRIDGQWLKVPQDAVVTEPNKFGSAVVWPYKDLNNVTQIRCFLPGTEG